MAGYTKIPNYILDEILPSLNGNEFKVLVAILRKTAGWQKNSDAIALSQLKELTGIKHSQTLIKCIKSLESKDMINVTAGTGTQASVYELSSSIKNELLNMPSGIKNRPLNGSSGIKNRHTKESFKYNVPYIQDEERNKVIR